MFFLFVGFDLYSFDSLYFFSAPREGSHSSRSHSLQGAPRAWERAIKGEGHGCGAHPRATPNTPRAYTRNLVLRPPGPKKGAPQPAQLTPALFWMVLLFKRIVLEG